MEFRFRDSSGFRVGQLGKINEGTDPLKPLKLGTLNPNPTKQAPTHPKPLKPKP